MSCFAPPRNVDEVISAIRTDGVRYWKDASKGQAADEFTRDTLPFNSSEGLDFCKAHVFDDPLVLGVLEGFFDLSVLGTMTQVTPFPGRALAYFGQEAESQFWRIARTGKAPKISAKLPRRLNSYSRYPSGVLTRQSNTSFSEQR
ncbi:MAG: hypothetical protein M1814_000927 [Vezdaea aestivalis]|nr:MAG: hypothetical protein M1814_000927 [Vezdaea aestivalis]